jgi:uncharacterized cupin superfamily protein
MPDTMSPACMAELPAVVPSRDGAMLNVLGAPMLVKSDTMRAGVFLADHTVPPGYAVPPHIHDTEGEVFYILEGELTLEGPQGVLKAGPGDTAALPCGKMHSFRNETGAPVRFLVIAADGRRAAAMFRALDRLAEPTQESVGATCAAHGVRLV